MTKMAFPSEGWAFVYTMTKLPLIPFFLPQFLSLAKGEGSICSLCNLIDTTTSFINFLSQVEAVEEGENCSDEIMLVCFSLFFNMLFLQ